MRVLAKARAVLQLLVGFIRDLIGSTWAVARIVLAPDIPSRPAIVVMPVQVKRPWAVAMLAYFTSLTPGSTCLHVSADRTRLYLHLLDASDPDASIARFHRLYERPIMELEG
ncbi:MAG TPA: Na+/H+ antiporter subunit E [Croceibacterium sp.]|nr:Na+/H+ antiporter subunit E [Croceibacterium sp.]